MVGNYEIITLCGSTKFKDTFIKAQKELTLKGKIVISVGLFGHADDEYGNTITEEVKTMLDDMHKRKIDMSDAIMVIDDDDYVGKSTQSEIDYAKAQGKFVYFYHHPEAYYDNVGGYHDSGTGYNPNDVYCGECSRLSCKGCKSENSTNEKFNKYKKE